MHVLVMNCFHWIGYHIADQLLVNSYKVDGIAGEPANQKDHLSMFLGRNSAFQLKTAAASETSYDAVITMGECVPSDVRANRCLCINGTDCGQSGLAETVIHTPLLFGEWMPMNEEGLYMEEQFIRFDSKCFQTEAIYIEDFTRGILQWLQVNELPNVLDVKQETAGSKAVKLENTIYLRNNRAKEINMTRLQDHYRRFQNLYD
jgi:hypothetical protein